MILTFFICSVIADRILILFKFPAEILDQVSNHPHYQKHIETIEYKQFFRTNSQGLRYQEIPLEKPAGSYRVFVAGDSFTEGQGVEEDQTFSSFLEKTFSAAGRETRFINGGLADTGPYEYARIFFNFGLKYHPDALLICIFANDTRDTPSKINLSLLYNIKLNPAGYRRILYLIWPRTFAAGKRIIGYMAWRKATHTRDFVKKVVRKAEQRNIPAEDILAWKAKLPQQLVDAVNQGKLGGHGLASGLLRPHHWKECIDIDSPEAEKRFQSMILILNEMVGYCRENEIDVAAVYIPSPFQYDPSVYDPKILNPYRISGALLDKKWLTEKNRAEARIESWAGSAAVPFLDLTPALRQAVQKNGSLIYPLDGHFTAQGQRVAGEIIAQWIRKEKVFPIQ